LASKELERRKVKLKTVLGVLLALGLAGSAMADIIDFSGVSSVDPGLITYLGGANPLVGSNILINGVFGTGTPNNSGPTFGVTDGRLDFTTGGFSSYIPSLNLYVFGGGGSLTITGTGPGGSSGTLLSGSIISAEYQAGTFKVALAAGDDTKNVNLLTFFGEPAGLTWQFSGQVNTSTAPPPPVNILDPAGFSLQSTGSTDVKNSEVPDGGMTVMLLGCALVGLESLRRKFRV
jgi:hypothetical protein